MALGNEWRFHWVAVPWGICLVGHAAAVFAGRFFGTEWEQRKVDKHLHRDDLTRH